MRHDLKIRTVLTIGAIYLYVLMTLASGGAPMVLLGLIYVGLTVAAGASLLESDLALVASDSQVFRRGQPFRGLGGLLTQFQHVYYSEKDLLSAVRLLASKKLLERREYTDQDPDLLEQERREFYIVRGEVSRRESVVSAIVHTRSQGEVQSVEWWILVQGFVDRNKRAYLLASSPLAWPLWVWRKIKQELDLSSTVRTVHPAFYNDLDVVTEARILHTLLFDSLVETLEDNGVDTSDLKQQRAQVMNISVSGGSAKFGNVVQAVKKARVANVGGVK